jgi:hypothetical protein
MGTEIGTSGRPWDEKAEFRKSELNDGHGAFEMDGHAPVELANNDTGKQSDPKGMSNLLDKTDRARITRMANWKHG